jgi:hypothetical protein
MKKWKAVAGTLAMLMGISGAALADDWDHRDQDWRNNGAYGYQVEHRDNYRTYGYPNYAYNNYYGHDRDRDRDRDRDHDRNKFRDHDRDHDRNRNQRGDRDRR